MLQNNVTSLTEALSESLNDKGDSKLSETVENLNNELKNVKLMNTSLSEQNRELTESNTTLLTANKESEKLVTALTNENEKLSESNKELKSRNTTFK